MATFYLSTSFLFLSHMNSQVYIVHLSNTHLRQRHAGVIFGCRERSAGLAGGANSAETPWVTRCVPLKMQQTRMDKTETMCTTDQRSSRLALTRRQNKTLRKEAEPHKRSLNGVLTGKTCNEHWLTINKLNEWLTIYVGYCTGRVSLQSIQIDWLHWTIHMPGRLINPKTLFCEGKRRDIKKGGHK